VVVFGGFVVVVVLEVVVGFGGRVVVDELVVVVGAEPVSARLVVKANAEIAKTTGRATAHRRMPVRRRRIACGSDPPLGPSTGT
jgi:hypothetical protein